MPKLVIVTFATIMFAAGVGGIQSAAATQIRSRQIAGGSSFQRRPDLQQAQRLLAIEKCTLKRYRRPRFQG
jgi:hypothetical protein